MLDIKQVNKHKLQLRTFTTGAEIKCPEKPPNELNSHADLPKIKPELESYRVLVIEGKVRRNGL